MLILSISSVFGVDDETPAPASVSVNGHGETQTTCPKGDTSQRSLTPPAPTDQTEVDPTTGKPVIVD